MLAIRKFVLGATVLALMANCVPCFTAQAQTTYTFVGRKFNQHGYGIGCPPSCLISGWFTVPRPLAANILKSGVNHG